MKKLLPFLFVFWSSFICHAQSAGPGQITYPIGSASSAPSGTAGGDLSGTYPNPVVSKINGTIIPSANSTALGEANNVSGGYATVDTGGQTSSAYGYQPWVTFPNVPNILQDTQLASDPDNTTGLAILLALQRRGSCNIIAVVSDTYSVAEAPAINCCLTYGGTGSIPVGSFQSATTPVQTIQTFATNITSVLPTSLFPGNNGETTNANLDAVKVARQALARMPDQSVTYSMDGGWSTLYYLLQSPADTISPLTGTQLFSAKVSQIFCVASGSAEYNLALDPANTVSAHNTVIGLTVPSHITWIGTVTTIPIIYFTNGMSQSLTVNPNTYSVVGSPMLLNNIGTSRQDWGAFHDYLEVIGFSHNGNTYVTATKGTLTINSSTGANTFAAGAGDDYTLAYATGGAAQLLTDIQALLPISPLSANPEWTNSSHNLVSNTLGASAGYTVNLLQGNPSSVVGGAFQGYDANITGGGSFNLLSFGHDNGSTNNTAFLSWLYTSLGSASNCWQLAIWGHSNMRGWGSGDVTTGAITADSGFGFETGTAKVDGLLTLGAGASFTTIGSTASIKGGSNAASGTVTLSSGVATVSSTAITGSDVIISSLKTASGTPGTYRPLATVTTGTITFSGLATDNSTYNWAALHVNQ